AHVAAVALVRELVVVLEPELLVAEAGPERPVAPRDHVLDEDGDGVGLLPAMAGAAPRPVAVPDDAPGVVLLEHLVLLVARFAVAVMAEAHGHVVGHGARLEDAVGDALDAPQPVLAVVVAHAQGARALALQHLEAVAAIGAGQRLGEPHVDGAAGRPVA